MCLYSNNCICVCVCVCVCVYLFLMQADYKDRRPCFLYSLGDCVDKDGCERQREKERMDKYTSPSCHYIHKLPVFLYQFSTSPLQFLSLSSFSLSGKCVLNLEKPEGERRRKLWGWLEGNSIEPTYSPPFPHLLHFFAFFLSLAFLAQRGAIRGQRCTDTLWLSFPLLHKPLVEP